MSCPKREVLQYGRAGPSQDLTCRGEEGALRGPGQPAERMFSKVWAAAC